MDLNKKYMRAAMKEAHKAELKDEVPIGAVIVCDGKIIARAHNTRQTKQISTHHAEILCIEKACRKLNSWRLEGCDLYVTLEPCPMCAGAIINSRIKNVYFGAKDIKNGALCTIFYCETSIKSPKRSIFSSFSDNLILDTYEPSSC